MLFILIHLFSWSASSRASDASCAEAASTYVNCANVAGSSEPIAGAPDAQVRELVARFHAALPNSPTCRRSAQAAADACGTTSQEMNEAHRRLFRNVRALDRWRQAVIMQARQLGAPVNLAVTCVPILGGRGLERCYVLDRTRPHTVVIERANSGELPFTVGISGRCTFTVDPYGHLVTADHCGSTLQYGGWILQTLGDLRVSAEPVARLEVSNVNINSGQPFEDLSIWQSPEAPRGRAFYVLTRDEAREDGCEIENDFYLACAPKVFATLNGRRAHTLGFPTLRYQRRDRAETVVRSDGDLIFDAEGNRFLIHAAVSPGSSGGPTYLLAGERVGGVQLDRPLFLGPLSAYAGSDLVTTVDQSDVLAIVAIYEFSHVRQVLPAY